MNRVARSLPCRVGLRDSVARYSVSIRSRRLQERRVEDRRQRWLRSRLVASAVSSPFISASACRIDVWYSVGRSLRLLNCARNSCRGRRRDCSGARQRVASATLSNSCSGVSPCSGIRANRRGSSWLGSVRALLRWYVLLDGDRPNEDISGRNRGRRTPWPGRRATRDGSAGCRPPTISSTGSTRPTPKKYAHMRLTAARAKYGLSLRVIQSARITRGSVLVLPRRRLAVEERRLDHLLGAGDLHLVSPATSPLRST